MSNLVVVGLGVLLAFSLSTPAYIRYLLDLEALLLLLDESVT